jgi:hypothetical protein
MIVREALAQPAQTAGGVRGGATGDELAESGPSTFVAHPRSIDRQVADRIRS